MADFIFNNSGSDMSETYSCQEEHCYLLAETFGKGDQFLHEDAGCGHKPAYSGYQGEYEMLCFDLNDRSSMCIQDSHQIIIKTDCPNNETKGNNQMDEETIGDNESMFDGLEGSTEDTSVIEIRQSEAKTGKKVNKPYKVSITKKRQGVEDIKFKKSSKQQSLKPSPVKPKTIKSSSSDTERQMDESDSEVQVISRRQRLSPPAPRRVALQAGNSNDIVEIFRSVVRSMNGVSILNSTEDILKAYSTEYVAEIVSIISGAVRYASNLQEFKVLVQTQIGEAGSEVRRKDEYQKKAYSKWAYRMYLETFKFTPKYLREHAQEDMRAYFNMKGEEKVEVFDRIFGEDRKKGVNNTAVYEILTNKVIVEEMLSLEYLEKTLEGMNEQTEVDIETMLVEKFKACPKAKGLLNELRDETQDGIATPRKKQSFKLPWSLSQNIQSLIYFLEKLEYRAKKENLVPERELIQSRIEHFQSLKK